MNQSWPDTVDGLAAPGELLVQVRRLPVPTMADQSLRPSGRG